MWRFAVDQVLMQKSNKEKSSLFLALSLVLVSANASYAQREELFDVEPPKAKPQPVEAPRAIIMDMKDDEQSAEKKAGKFSFFKHPSENKKQIASNDLVKDVPDDNVKSGGALSHALSMPKSAAGVMCGLVVGVPVRAAKTMASETKRINNQVTNDLTWDGKKPDITARTFGAALSVPFGVATGIMTGITKGAERAVHTGSRKPFSKESMSISDPEYK